MQLRAEMMNTDANSHVFAVVTNGHQFLLAHRAPSSHDIALSPVICAGAEPKERLLPNSPGGLLLCLTLLAADCEGWDAACAAGEDEPVA